MRHIDVRSIPSRHATSEWLTRPALSRMTSPDFREFDSRSRRERAPPRRGRRDVLTLDDLRTASDAEMATFDVAEVDLACASGLPGSGQPPPRACLAWLGRAAAWTHQHT